MKYRYCKLSMLLFVLIIRIIKKILQSYRFIMRAILFVYTPSACAENNCNMFRKRLLCILTAQCDACKKILLVLLNTRDVPLTYNDVESNLKNWTFISAKLRGILISWYMYRLKSTWKSTIHYFFKFISRKTRDRD